MLLLDDNISFIERDALLSGALEVSVDGRYNMNKHEALLQKLCQVLGAFCIYPLTPILLLLLL